MALYLARAGRTGEHEKRFLEDGRIYFTWSGFNRDLNEAKDLNGFYTLFGEVYPDATRGRMQNHARQAYQFCRCMNKGDWVVLPSRTNPTLHFGKITGECKFDPKAADSYYNSRKIEWFKLDVPRERFDQDLLYSFGAFLTFCRIQRNNAEARVKEMEANDWKVPSGSHARLAANDPDETEVEAETESEAVINLESTAYEQIARLILARFKGHGLASLVKAILESEGYTVFQPPEGPDHGVDLLAAPGSMGFGQPRLCVQVKSQEGPVERVVLDQLIGTMQNHGAHHGLLVSWGGFKQTIERERAAQFFRVRLWNRDDLIRALLANYEKLDPTIRAELPLKRFWMVAADEEN
jgi:restriction system protein